ncbi:hypothetical protein B0H13DRAFT_1707068 [Mycena leptocephala]|nr:hypothetical protein B0H13DRAFT_1707068 [Mycena leptocephala]
MASMPTDELQKAEKLWFSPDVVILRAQTRIFRVFAAILQEKSSVFADMFRFPQPPSSDMESIEGFPVIVVHDDPEEVEVFLKAIFDSSAACLSSQRITLNVLFSFFMPPPAEIKCEDTLGILRLAHKYDVPYLRCRALEHLTKIYPTSLSAYDGRRDNNTISVSAKALGRRLATIETATEVGALWLLPVVYYDICMHQLSMITEDPRWMALGENERRACLSGYSAQSGKLLQISKFLSVAKDEEDDDCEDWARCNNLRLKLSFGLNDSISCSTMWPLDYWTETAWKAMGRFGICDPCMTEAKALFTDARRKYWDELPAMFGLPEWEKLEEMRQVALPT